MLSRLRNIGLFRRVLAIGPGFVDSFLRGNKVIPPVLAVLALLIFSWVVAGIFVGEPEEERVANQANVVAQSQDDSGDDGSDSLAPQVESRDADSYAAYESKDPFRQLFAPADSGEDTNQETTGGGATAPEDTSGAGGGSTTGGGGGAGGGGGSGAGGGSSGGFQDSDDDGLSNRREKALDQDPQNPDTDGDGTLDGADDSDGDGVPDGRSRNTGGNGRAGGSGDGGSGAGTGGDGLFDSGGSLP